MNYTVKELVKNVLRNNGIKRMEKDKNNVTENPIDFGSICKWIFKSDDSTMEFIISDLDKKLPMNYIFNQCTINDDDEGSGISQKYVLTVKRVGLNEF